MKKRTKVPKELKDCLISKNEIDKAIEKADPRTAGWRNQIIAETQLFSPKLKVFIKKQILDWIITHQSGVTPGHDMMVVAENEHSDGVSYLRVNYLDFLDLEKEVSK